MCFVFGYVLTVSSLASVPDQSGCPHPGLPIPLGGGRRSGEGENVKNKGFSWKVRKADAAAWSFHAWKVNADAWNVSAAAPDVSAEPWNMTADGWKLVFRARRLRPEARARQSVATDV
jgi:hypothetical protein